NGAHCVHLRVARGSVATLLMNGLEDRAGSAQRQPRAPVRFRYERGEIAGRGQSVDEFAWICGFVIELGPVGVWKVFTNPTDPIAQLLPLGFDGNREGNRWV